MNGSNYNNETNVNNSGLNSVNGNELLKPQPIPPLRGSDNNINNTVVNNNVNSNNGMLKPQPIPSLGNVNNNNSINNSNNTNFNSNNNNINNSSMSNQEEVLSNHSNTLNFNETQQGIGNQYNQTSNNIQSNINNNGETVDDEDLIKAYIGLNYDKIVGSKFSVPSLFFGQLYLFYRKMYLIGIIIFIVYAVITFLSAIPMIFLINIALAFMFNNIYMVHVKNKVTKIKNNNSNKTKEELLSICSSKGGTSVLSVVINILLEFVIAFIIFIICLFLGLAFGIFKLFTFGDVNLDENGNATKFEGIIVYDGNESDIDNNFYISVPNVFTRESYGYSYVYVSNNSELYNECNFSIDKVKNYTDAGVMAEQMSLYYNKYNQVSDKRINNITWKTFTAPGVLSTDYYYLVSIDNEVYMAKYEIEDNADSLVCEKYFDTIMNSISLKP